MKFFYALLALFTCCAAYAMEEGETLTRTEVYSFRAATKADIPALLKLMSECTAEDSKKIVIVPSVFRKKTLKTAIQEGKVFVATNAQGNIIGYKKLFIIKFSDLKALLGEEIRCLNENGTYKEPEACCYFAIIERAVVPQSTERTTANILPDQTSTLFIYDGADYTVPELRGLGINSGLTSFALKTILQQIHSSPPDTTINAFALVYGLIDQGQVVEGGRTTNIARLFSDALLQAGYTTLASNNNTIELACARFHAYKPEFDQETGNPLPDDQAIPGFGYILTYFLPTATLDTFPDKGFIS